MDSKREHKLVKKITKITETYFTYMFMVDNFDEVERKIMKFVGKTVVLWTVKDLVENYFDWNVGEEILIEKKKYKWALLMPMIF